MASRNKRKLAATNKENCEEHPRSNLASNSIVPRSQEDYITQVSEEIEGRVTKKLSQEFRRTENRILGALARFDDCIMNPLLQGHSGITPEASRRRPGMCLVKTRERMRMTPRVTLILKQAYSPLFEKTATTWRQESKGRVQLVRTWWQEFTKKLCTAHLAHLPESRKRTALQVNLNFAAKLPLRQLKQTKFCWRFSS